MATETTNYLREAADDAAETVRNFEDEILEQLIDNGEASDDLFNDYPNGDSWHHESHVDKWYSLTDAAELIDQLSDHEETDNGLWEGQQPKEAIGTCAAYTYGNAVLSEWNDLIKEINGEADTIISDFADDETTWEEEIAGLENDADAAESDEDADEYRRNAEAKREELDGLAEKKKEALRAMIAECADNA
jgi:hypothetical protein